MSKNKKEITSIGLQNIHCPVCDNGINWVKPLGDYTYDGVVRLLAECWSVNNHKHHLFIIELKTLPVVTRLKKIPIVEESLDDSLE